MHWLEELSSHLVFTREYLKAGVLVSLLSVWVLVALFYYLNRYTRRRYFTIWTAAWLFYALWITLSFRVPGNRNEPLLLMFQQWCIGVSAIFLLWGSRSFLGEKVGQGLFGFFFIFLLAWSYLGAYRWSRPLEMEVPVFSLIALASIVTAASFFRYRRKNPSYIGATLLTLGFFLWGVYMAGYPFLENSQDLTSLALFLSAGLQLMLAVSMIILVLEEVRQTQQAALAEAQTRKAERDVLQTRVTSTEERYRKLFDQASEAIVIASAEDLRILELNQAAERLLGISRAEAERQSLTTFCQVKNASGAVPATGAEWFQAICRQHPLNLMRKNGALTPVEINGTQIEFDEKPAYQFFVLELTERARLEQQLRQAEKLSAIGQMISGVAHELNNPLAVVKGYLELVLAHHPLSPQTRSDLEKAAHESNRAAKLVMNFLTFAREQRSHREPVNLNDLARQLVDLRRADFIAAKTEVGLELDPKLPLVSADPDQVQQLMVNLINNSMQAMANLPRPARLKIKTSANEGRVQLLVEDNGPGVPPHLVNKIFEPFFTTKEVGSGTGLGLSIAHSLMSEHRGRIYYQTSSWGGAGFVLEFPKAAIGDLKKNPGDAGVMTMGNKPAESEPGGAGSILVLDDEKSIAEMLGEMLGLLGYTPTVCHAGAQALELIDQEDFDLIISDFRMPVMNGRQFYEQAVKKKPALARRVIFLTGDIVNEETQAFLKSIGNPHMTKPFNMASVKAIVVEALQANGGGEPART